MMSVRPTWGVTVSGVNGLWEHGTFDLLAGGNQPGGRVEAEIGYGLPAFGTAGVLTPYAGASLTDAGGGGGVGAGVPALFSPACSRWRSTAIRGSPPDSGTPAPAAT